MILSVSRRTDIPAFFPDWFLNRLQAQYADVRNPVNPRQVSRICLSPDVVDCIVFWSKNPAPMLSRLHSLQDYMYYFQFTLNGYGKDFEPGLPSAEERISTFRALSDAIGKQRVIWRYDPVIVTDRYSVDWHLRTFRYLASRLHSCTETVIISFIDLYACISRAARAHGITELSACQRDTLACHFAKTAHLYDLEIRTCAEDMDLSSYGISQARCIDGRLITKLLGCPIAAGKDRSQRPACGCAASIDIGFYNTCPNGCVYCYANHSSALRAKNLQAYDPCSTLLCSRLTEQDKIHIRKVKSLKEPYKRLCR